MAEAMPLMSLNITQSTKAMAFKMMRKIKAPARLKISPAPCCFWFAIVIPPVWLR